MKTTKVDDAFIATEKAINASRDKSAPPFKYLVGGKINTQECMTCGRKFETSMRFLKYCSPLHRDIMVATLTGNRKLYDELKKKDR